MINNQLKIIYKKNGSFAWRKNTLKKKTRVSTGFYRVAQVTGQTGGPTRFCQVFAHLGLLSCPTRSNHQVPGRPTGPVQVYFTIILDSLLWIAIIKLFISL